MSYRQWLMLRSFGEAYYAATFPIISTTNARWCPHIACAPCPWRTWLSCSTPPATDPAIFDFVY